MVLKGSDVLVMFQIISVHVRRLEGSNVLVMLQIAVWMLGGSNVLALLIILTILCVRKGDDVSDDIYEYSYEDDEDDDDNNYTVCETAGEHTRDTCPGTVLWCKNGSHASLQFHEE